jgi:hypothetical protein
MVYKLPALYRKQPSKTSGSTGPRFSTRIPQLGLAEGAMYNLSAAIARGLCLSAFIDQPCVEGSLSFIATASKSF